MNNLNEYRHFFLYAKGWYAKGNVLEDLGKICNHYLEHDLHSGTNRIRILTEATKTIKTEFTIDKVLSKVLDESFQFNYPFDFGQHELSATQVVIRTTLMILGKCTIDEIEGSLGTPDYSILPKAE